MIDYNIIQFQFPLDNADQHMGTLSHYRRDVEHEVEVEILSDHGDMLGMVANQSDHAHRYRTDEITGLLPRNHFNFFHIPQHTCRWVLEPGINTILFLTCTAEFLALLVADVPVLNQFLSSVAVGRFETLNPRHMALTSEILDDIFELTRESRYTGNSRKTFLRAKAGNMIFSGLLTTQAYDNHAVNTHDAEELRNVYQYMINNLQYISDTRPLMNLSSMPDEKLKTKFKLHYGKSLIEALRYERLKKAEDLLLNTTMPILEIAAAVGYSSSAAFVDAFRNQYRIYPKEYRRKFSKLDGHG